MATFGATHNHQTRTVAHRLGVFLQRMNSPLFGYFPQHTIRRCVLLAALAVLSSCVAAPEIPPVFDSDDEGVANSVHSAPLVYLQEPFDSDDFRSHFHWTGSNQFVSISSTPDSARAGPVLRVEIPSGNHLGANFAWRFKDHTVREPDRLYSRYFVYFEPGWESGQGGKLPGPSGTYRRAGWGGRSADGTNGWSARMGFKQGFGKETTQLTYYAYYPDSGQRYGKSIYWDRTASLLALDSVGELKHGRWYCIESYIRLNDPQQSDGLLIGWVDEALATYSNSLRFRTTAELLIEEYWFNVYFGGKAVPTSDLIVYFDDLVLSDTRLGCSTP